MSKKIIAIGLFILTAYPISSFAQTMERPQSGSDTTSQAAPSTVPSSSTEGRVFDEGQVQVPREGQVETIPEGHVEAVNPTAVQPSVQDKQPDLFQFESRLFNPIPSD